MIVVRALLVAALLIGLPAVAQAQGQSFGPAHHTIAIVGQATGATNARPAFNRKLLGLINDSANVVWCTVDGTTATTTNGIKLAATGTTGDRAFFDRYVPMGPVRCMSATNGSAVHILEGR